MWPGYLPDRALTSISVQTGATIQGSALARNGAVTLDNNVISIADCMTGTISGAKFNDLNGDGLQQFGEPMLAGYTVYIDVNSNDVLDPGESQTTTDASGNYSFSNLVPGTYRIRQLQGAGFTQTTPNPGPIDLDEGDTVTDVDFGDFLSASIAGAKFRDMNGNGVRDAGDAGIAGFTVFLDANTNGVFDVGEVSTVSDANGNYTFTGLGPGTYTVREVQQLGYVRMTANPLNIVAISGGNISGVLFGNILVTDLLTVNKLLLTGRNLTNLLNGTISRQAAFVADLYETNLGRVADVVELSYYLRLLMAGYTEQQVTTLFLAEYFPPAPIVVVKAAPKKAAAPTPKKAAKSTPKKVASPAPAPVKVHVSVIKTSRARSRK